MKMLTRIPSILLLSAMLACPAAHAAAPWHADGWSHRAVVQVTGGGSPNVDVARLRIHHNGLTQDDAADYRIFDAAGKPVPYQVTYHAPGRDTLISFRSPRPGGEFYVYFANPSAKLDPMRAIDELAPGSGPPRPGPAADGWIPRTGLTLITMRRPEEAPNPETVGQMAELVAGSSRLDGAGYRRNISDGVNPFGNSDHFISVYRGWIDLPRSGEYDFCTASNEASFSFLDGQTLVHWPGRHTEKRGEYGQKSATHTLDAGRHYVEYYHEEVLLYQVMFLGWKPPGGDRLWSIPNDRFPRPHAAKVVRYETAGARPTAMIHPRLVDSVWPQQRPAGQYTQYRFIADAGDKPAGWKVAWDFGDGQTAAGADVRHVYTATGTYTVTMTHTPPGRPATTRAWPLVVFPVEHLEGEFKAGDRADYGEMLADTDRASLPTRNLLELAHFFDERGQRSEAIAAAEAVIERGDAERPTKFAAHLLAAGDAGLRENVWRFTGDTRRAAAIADHLESARGLADSPVNQMIVLARLIRHLGVNRADLPAAESHYEQAERIVQEVGMTPRLKRAFRDATIAAGDAHLFADQPDRAGEDYRTAEALSDPVVPKQVRAAKVGGYPETIEQHLGEGRLDDAGAVIYDWHSAFPSEQLRGEVLMYIGKQALAKGRPAAAITPLRLAVRLAEGAVFEPEARWRLAEAYRASGEADAARAALHALVETRVASPYRDRAIEALKPE